MSDKPNVSSETIHSCSLVSSRPSREELFDDSDGFFEAISQMPATDTINNVSNLFDDDFDSDDVFDTSLPEMDEKESMTKTRMMSSNGSCMLQLQKKLSSPVKRKHSGAVITTPPKLNR